MTSARPGSLLRASRWRRVFARSPCRSGTPAAMSSRASTSSCRDDWCAASDMAARFARPLQDAAMELGRLAASVNRALGAAAAHAPDGAGRTSVPREILARRHPLVRSLHRRRRGATGPTRCDRYNRPLAGPLPARRFVHLSVRHRTAPDPFPNACLFRGRRPAQGRHGPGRQRFVVAGRGRFGQASQDQGGHGPVAVRGTVAIGARHGSAAIVARARSEFPVGGFRRG